MTIPQVESFNETARKSEPQNNARFNEALPLLELGLSRRDTLCFEITQSSMSPLFSPGDKVYAQKINLQNLYVGDIVIFKTEGSLIAHRLIGFQGSFYAITKGDNNFSADKPVLKENIIAKITSLEQGGHIFNFETRLWKISHFFLSQISSLEAQSLNSAFGKKIVRISKFLVGIINVQYFRLLYKKRDTNKEKELILKLCENTATIKDIKITEELTVKCYDWNQFLSLVRYNNIGPIVFRNLPKNTSNLVPTWVMDHLKEMYKESFLKAEMLYQDLRTLLKICHQHHLSVIILKGAAIAEELYQDISLRPMEDIDILVKKQDWPVIKNILKELKFKNPDGLDLLKLDQASPIAMDRHVAYINDNGTKLEFKFHLFSLDFPDFLSMNHYFEEAISKKIAGVDALVLNPEDQFLYLSTRLMNAGFCYLLWLHDLKVFLAYHKMLNWDLLLEKAKSKKVTTTLYFALTLLSANFNLCEIPDNIIRALRPPLFKERWFKKLFHFNQRGFREANQPSHLDPMITNYLLLGKFDLSFKGIMQIIGFSFQTLFPTVDYVAYRYSIPKWQVYFGRGYCSRIQKLLGKLFF